MAFLGGRWRRLARTQTRWNPSGISRVEDAARRRSAVDPRTSGLAGGATSAAPRGQLRHVHDRRPRGVGAGELDARRRRQVRRHRDPGLLLRAQARPAGRRLPHVPGRDRGHPEAPDRLLDARQGRHGRAHADRARARGAARGRRVPADQPSARLPGLRQGRRVPAPGHHLRLGPRHVALRRAQAPLPQAAGDLAADRDRSRALHPLLPLRALLAGGLGGLPAGLVRARRALVRLDVRRAPLRRPVQRQHHRALPGRRAHLHPVPLPRAAVGHRGGGHRLHLLPGAVQRRADGARRPRDAGAGARPRGGRRRLAVRQGPLRLPVDAHRRAHRPAARARGGPAGAGVVGEGARRGGGGAEEGWSAVRRTGRRGHDQRGGVPARPPVPRGARLRPARRQPGAGAASRSVARARGSRAPGDGARPRVRGCPARARVRPRRRRADPGPADPQGRSPPRRAAGRRERAPGRARPERRGRAPLRAGRGRGAARRARRRARRRRRQPRRRGDRGRIQRGRGARAGRAAVGRRRRRGDPLRRAPAGRRARRAGGEGAAQRRRAARARGARRRRAARDPVLRQRARHPRGGLRTRPRRGLRSARRGRRRGRRERFLPPARRPAADAPRPRRLGRRAAQGADRHRARVGAHGHGPRARRRRLPRRGVRREGGDDRAPRRARPAAAPGDRAPGAARRGGAALLAGDRRGRPARGARPRRARRADGLAAALRRRPVLRRAHARRDRRPRRALAGERGGLGARRAAVGAGRAGGPAGRRQRRRRGAAARHLALAVGGPGGRSLAGPPLHAPAAGRRALARRRRPARRARRRRGRGRRQRHARARRRAAARLGADRLGVPGRGDAGRARKPAGRAARGRPPGGPRCRARARRAGRPHARRRGLRGGTAERAPRHPADAGPGAVTVLAKVGYYEDWWIQLLKALVIFAVVFQFVPIVLLAERKVLGRFQHRYGPNRVGPFGIFQPMADIGKLLFKQQFRPDGSIGWMFALAPAISMFTAVSVAALVPFSDTVDIFGTQVGLYGIDPSIGVLYAFAFGGIAFYGLVLGGWSSGGKYAFLGSMRAAAQLISYEIAQGLALVGVVMMAGSLSLTEIVGYQEDHLWMIVPQFVGFVIFFVAGFAETNRPPFDLPEADAELVQGYSTEYGGGRFAAYFAAEYLNMVVMSGIMVTLFFGGWDIPFWDQPN